MVRFQNDVLPIVAAAERQMVESTSAYLAAVQSTADGTRFLQPRIPYRDLTGAALRGVEPSVLYRRPQMVVNYRISQGDSLTEAVRAGGHRLRSITATNLQLAKTRTVQKLGTAPFYRRVLTGKENCALCAVASTQRYRRGSLMPIHPGCDCGCEQIIDSQPPHVIDPALLEQTHSEIAAKLGGTDRSAQDLGARKRDVAGRPLSDFTDLVVTRQHGELGSVLAWRGDHFRDAAEAASL